MYLLLYGCLSLHIITSSNSIQKIELIDTIDNFVQIKKILKLYEFISLFQHTFFLILLSRIIVNKK